MAKKIIANEMIGRYGEVQSNTPLIFFAIKSEKRMPPKKH